VKTSTLLVLGGLGALAYFAYRSLRDSTLKAAGGMALPSASAGMPSAGLPSAGLPAGLQAQIDAGTYNAQGLRMGFNTPAASFSGVRRG
jgi:hypothetical protein